MKLFRDFERRVDEQLRKLFGSGAATTGQGKELIEIQRAILDRIEERIEQLPRARRVFPYNEVAVTIPIPSADRRVVFEAVFAGLREEIIDHLRDGDVEFDAKLRVDVTYVETAELTEPTVVCRSNATAPAPAAVSAPAPATHAPVQFTPPGVEINRTRIQVGRQAEVMDERRRLVRRNDLVLEHDTVSRAHAHIEWTDGEYRLFDDGSSYGTSVIHNGRLTEVPRTGGRGVRLQSGDEIYFGQLRVRFDVLQP